jgi:hypothetical protein
MRCWCHWELEEEKLCDHNAKEFFLSAPEYTLHWQSHTQRAHEVHIQVEYEKWSEVIQRLEPKELELERGMGVQIEIFRLQGNPELNVFWDFVTFPGMIATVNVDSNVCNRALEEALRLYDGPLRRSARLPLECDSNPVHSKGRMLHVEASGRQDVIRRVISTLHFNSYKLCGDDKCPVVDVNEPLALSYNNEGEDPHYKGWLFRNVDIDSFLKLSVHNFSYDGLQRGECLYAGVYFHPLLNVYNYNLSVCHHPHLERGTQDISLGSLTHTFALYILHYPHLGAMRFNLSVQNENCQTVLNPHLLPFLCGPSIDDFNFTADYFGLELKIMRTPGWGNVAENYEFRYTSKHSIFSVSIKYGVDVD